MLEQKGLWKEKSDEKEFRENGVVGCALKVSACVWIIGEGNFY